MNIAQEDERMILIKENLLGMGFEAEQINDVFQQALTALG